MKPDKLFPSIASVGMLWMLSVPTPVEAVTFADDAQYAVGQLPHGLAMGDVDGDGLLDIVVANILTDDISILMNVEDGVFAPEVRYAAGGSARVVTLGDLDNDSDLDVVVGLQRSPNVFAVLRNTGAGTFSAPVLHGAALGTPQTVLARMLNQDDDLDVAVVLAGDGGRVAVYQNHGGGSFSNGTLHTIQTSGFDGGLASGDLDLDGDLDLVASFVYSSVTPARLTNRGNGSFDLEEPFETTTSTTPGIAVGDLNGDEADDIALIMSGDLRVFLNDGSGSFGPHTDHPPGVLLSSVTRMALGDLDDDQDLDAVLTGSSSSQVGVLLNDGTGEFGDGSQHPTGSFCSYVAVGDLNGDALLDVVATNRDGSSVSVLLNQTVPTSIGGATQSTSGYALWPPAPNPTRGEATIAFQVPRITAVEIGVFDSAGRLVRVLDDGMAAEGIHRLRWNGRSASGRPVAPGVYFFRLTSDSFQQARKIILLP